MTWISNIFDLWKALFNAAIDLSSNVVLIISGVGVVVFFIILFKRLTTRSER